MGRCKTPGDKSPLGQTLAVPMRWFGVNVEGQSLCNLYHAVPIYGRRDNTIKLSHPQTLYPHTEVEEVSD